MTQPALDLGIITVHCAFCPHKVDLFLTYVSGTGRVTVWRPRIAHDDGCPAYAKIQEAGQ